MSQRHRGALSQAPISENRGGIAEVLLDHRIALALIDRLVEDISERGLQRREDPRARADLDDLLE